MCRKFIGKPLQWSSKASPLDDFSKEFISDFGQAYDTFKAFVALY